MPTPALTPTDVVWSSVAPTRLGAVEWDPETDDRLEVWVCDKSGGPRVVKLPADVATNVSWTQTLGEPGEGSFDIARYRTETDDPEATDWWIDRLSQWETEAQIVWEGEIRHWGPVADVPDVPGAELATIPSPDCTWYAGQTVMRAADQVWSRNWVRNPSFASGLSQWITDGSIDTSIKESGYAQSLRLDVGESAEQTLTIGLGPSYDAKIRARVRIESGVTDAVLRVERTDLTQTIRAQASISELTPRDQWVWLVVDVRVYNPGVLPAEPTISIEATSGSGGINVQQMEWTVRPESLGLPGVTARAPYFTPSLAVAGIVARFGEDRAIGVLTDPLTDGAPIQAIWQTRGDMYASEALRALSDREDGIEYRWLYSPTARVLEAKQLIGQEHDPGQLTLVVSVDDSGDGGSDHAAGTIAKLSGSGGVDKPTTRVIARGEDGFSDTAEDLSGWGGQVFEEVVTVPMGITDKSAYAQAHLMNANTSTRTWDLTLTDHDLISVLRIGDRVTMVLDDGPSQFNGLVRVERITYAPGSATPITLTVSPWVDPGARVKMPRPAKALSLSTAEDEHHGLVRRVTDVERRLINTGGVDRLEDLLDVDVVYEGDESVADGDVLTWDEDTQRWVGAAASGGSHEDRSTRVDAEGGGAGTPPTLEDWTTTTVWGTPDNHLTTLDGTEGAIVEAVDAGVYIVSGSFFPVMGSSDFTVARLFTDDVKVDGSEECVVNEIAYQGAAVSELTITGQLALRPGDPLRAYCNQTAGLRVTLHRVADLPVADCGGGGET